MGTLCLCSGLGQLSPWPQHWGRDFAGEGTPGVSGKAGWEDKMPSAAAGVEGRGPGTGLR